MWLVGKLISKLPNRTLPAQSHVLSLFGFYHLKKKCTLKESAHNTTKDVLQLCFKLGIPTRAKNRVVGDVLNLFRTWSKLKKNKDRMSETEKYKQQYFKKKIKKIFSVINNSATKNVKNQKIQDFLCKQIKTCRPLRIYVLQNYSYEHKSVYDAITEDSVNVDLCDIKAGTNELRQSSLSPSLSICSDTNREAEFAPSKYFKLKNKAPSRKTLTTNVALTLDRVKVSNRKAAMLLPVITEALGNSASNQPVSYSSIRRTRQTTRLAEANKIRLDFKPVGPLTLHWDGKLLPAGNGIKKVERLPIVVSTATGDEQLLGIPALNRGTGDQMSKALFEHLIEWNIADLTRVMCFDTTSSNTGLKNGACVSLQNKLKIYLLFFACRHHVFELVIEAAFSVCFGPSAGPEPSIFKRFKESWGNLDKNNFESGSSDPDVATYIKHNCNEVNQFVSEKLLLVQPRDDYKELLELVLVFTGSLKKTKFRLPGAMHRARWMAKAIYALKIYIFRNEFAMPDNERNYVKRISMFVVTVYVFGWYNAPVTIEAPRNDLIFLKKLHAYKSIDSEISDAALNKFCRHLWYLSEEAICLSLFDEQVCVATKNKIAKISNADESTQEDKVISNRKVRAEINMNSIKALKLENFVSANSKHFFKILGIEDISFLNLNARYWTINDNYETLKKIIANLKVVNDPAERGVALVQSLNNTISKSEEQQQALFLTVRNHQKMLPRANKEDVIKIIHQS